MRWGRDNTGRFAQRPYYDQDELDVLCEDIVVEFLRQAHGRVQYPLSTDDITNLIDRDGYDLDLYADLHAEGDDVQGVTYFYRDKRPQIRIAKELAEQEWRVHRLRTTLTHEYGHARLHAALWSFDQMPLFPTTEPVHTHLNRDRGPRDAGDWMEWQAGYASAAFLMPVSAVRDLAGSHLRQWGEYGMLTPTSPRGRVLVAEAGRVFHVSAMAATVRLKQLGYLGTPQAVGILPGLGITD